MAGGIKKKIRLRATRSQRGSEESPLFKWLLISVALLFSLVFLFLPLLNVFAQAFGKGIKVYFASLFEPDARAAIRLTLIVAAISVPLNVLFGLAAAWAIAKFEFRGKALLDHTHRLALRGLAGGRGFDVRRALRPAGLLWRVARCP